MALRRLLLAACLCLSSSPVEAQPHAVAAALLLAEAAPVEAQAFPRRRSFGGGGFSPRRRSMSYSSPRRRSMSYSSPRRRSMSYGGGGYDGRRRGSTVIIGGGGYGGYDDDNYRYGGGRHYYRGGNDGGAGAWIFIIVFGMVFFFIWSRQGSTTYVNGVAVQDNQYQDNQYRAPDVFDFPPPPQGLREHGDGSVVGFVDALRQEYLGQQQGAVGEYMRHMPPSPVYDNVEDQIRNAQPDNRMDALNQLEQIWKDQVREQAQEQAREQTLQVAQAVPVAPNAFAPSAPPPAAAGFAPSTQQALEGVKGAPPPTEAPPTEATQQAPAAPPPTWRGIPRPAMDVSALAGFVGALRGEYQQRRDGAVGNWLNANEAIATPYAQVLDQVENMIRPNPAALDELQRAWGL